MPDIHIGERVVRPQPVFSDRRAAGDALAAFMAPGPGADALVLALPRGGVLVGEALARGLKARLEAAVARKLPVPWSPEMGFGAVACDGSLVLNRALREELGLSCVEVERIAERVRAEVRRRVRLYTGREAPPEVAGRSVVLTDDGLATGYTMLAAAEMVRRGGPRRMVLGVPVSPADSLEEVAPSFDEVWCLVVQEAPPFAVASFYEDFHDLSDEEVIAALRRASTG